MSKFGSWNVGSNNPKAKLTEEKVIQIRFMFASGYRVPELAEQYGVTKGCIWNAVRIRSWKHV